MLLWIRVAHGLPPWKIVWMLFFVGGLIRHHIFLEIAHLWEFQVKETKRVKEKKLWQRKRERECLKKIRPRKQLDTTVDPQNKHTIVDQGCWWTTPLKNCLDAFFCLGFNKASYIFGNWAFVRISKWKKLRKQLIKKSFSKGKGKGNVWKKSLQEAARHNSGPPKQTYYCGSGLLMDYPLEKLFEWCFFYWALIRHQFVCWQLDSSENFKWKELRK